MARVLISVKSTFVDEPHPADIILPPPVGVYGTSQHLTMVRSWARKNPRFSRRAVLRLLEQVLHIDEVGAFWDALAAAGAEQVGVTPDGTEIYQFAAPGPVEPDLFVTQAGFSYEPGPQPPADQVAVCRDWVRSHCRPTTTARKTSSYDLKHRVESWTESVPAYAGRLQVNRGTGQVYRDPRFYVSNGALIRAMLDEGYHAEPSHEGSVNAVFRASVTVSGMAHRGRPPGRMEREWVEVVSTRVSSDPDAVQARKLSLFLDRRRSFGQPAFEPWEAGAGVGMKMPKRHSPKPLIRLLRAAGCVRYRELVTRYRGKVQRTLWSRWSDMPEDWRQAHWSLNPTDPKPRVRKKRVPRPTVTRDEVLASLLRLGFVEVAGGASRSGRQRFRLPGTGSGTGSGTEWGATLGDQRTYVYKFVDGKTLPVVNFRTPRYSEDRVRSVVLETQGSPEFTSAGASDPREF